MNVLFISPSSPRESIGGIERYIDNLIGYCKNDLDLKVSILLPTSAEDNFVVEQNVSLYMSTDMTVTKKMSAVEIAQKARDFAATVEKIIKENNIDIICAENFHNGFPPAYSILLNVVSEIRKIPIVLRLHSFAIKDLQKELINQLMWKKISCVSISVAGDCFTKGADVNKLSTEYLGVNTETFNTEISSEEVKQNLGLTDKNKIILTASRIIDGTNNILAEKGIINLIESFSKISDKYPDLRLLIAVAKPPESRKVEFEIALEMLKGYIQLRNVEEKTFIKVFGLDEMPHVYRAADVFVLPSENETFGQVFVEAMACGVPVIGTKVGGIPEIISDSYNGFLVLPSDASVLAHRIETILDDEAIRKGFIEAGRETVLTKFTLKSQFSEFFEMLSKLIATK